MFFSLSNASATFLGYINKILAEKLDIFVIVYIDNILIYIKNPRQLHIEVIHLVMDSFRKHSLFANLKKCRFHQDEVCFLEYMVLLKEISIKVKKSRL